MQRSLCQYGRWLWSYHGNGASASPSGAGSYGRRRGQYDNRRIHLRWHKRSHRYFHPGCRWHSGRSGERPTSLGACMAEKRVWIEGGNVELADAPMQYIGQGEQRIFVEGGNLFVSGGGGGGGDLTNQGA